MKFNSSMISMHLRWRHNTYDGVSNHQSHDCLRNRLIRSRSKKTWRLRVTGLCVGNSPVTGEFPEHGPVTRKMFPSDDVIIIRFSLQHSVIYADVPEGLGTEHKTIAEYLQPHGYHSHYLGKWVKYENVMNKKMKWNRNSTKKNPKYWKIVIMKC